MRLFFYGFMVIAVLLATGIFLWSFRDKPQVVVLAGSGMKAPLLALAADFTRETGIEVQTHLDGSSVLRDYIIKFGTGDLFLPGDKYNLDVLAQKNLVVAQSTLAWHQAAILIAPQLKGQINSLDDLARQRVRLGVSNPRLASMGALAMDKIINVHPLRQDLMKNIVIYGSCSQDILRLYREGVIDAMFEWDMLARTPEGKGLIVVPLQAPYQVREEVRVGLLSCSKNPRLAQSFYNYLLTRGPEILRQHGYNSTPAPTAADTAR